MEKKKIEKPTTQPQAPHELTKDQLGSVTGGGDVYSQIGVITPKLTQFAE